jgi:hypothetical protein
MAFTTHSDTLYVATTRLPLLSRLSAQHQSTSISFLSSSDLLPYSICLPLPSILGRPWGFAISSHTSLLHLLTPDVHWQPQAQEGYHSARNAALLASDSIALLFPSAKYRASRLDPSRGQQKRQARTVVEDVAIQPETRVAEDPMFAHAACGQ